MEGSGRGVPCAATMHGPSLRRSIRLLRCPLMMHMCVGTSASIQHDLIRRCPIRPSSHGPQCRSDTLTLANPSAYAADLILWPIAERLRLLSPSQRSCLLSPHCELFLHQQHQSRFRLYPAQLIGGDHHRRCEVGHMLDVLIMSSHPESKGCARLRETRLT